MDSVKSTISSQEPLYKEDCLQDSSSHCCCLCLCQPPGPARPAQPAQVAAGLPPPRPGQNSCSLRLDFNSREYEDFKVIQGYKDLEILMSLPLVRLAGEMQLQSFRNRVVTEATMLRFEFLTRQDIHHP